MKKVKNAILIALSIALMYCFGMAVSAAESSYGNGDVASVDISQLYYLTNAGTTSPADTFCYTITFDNVTEGGTGAGAVEFSPNTFEIAFAEGAAGGSQQKAAVNLPDYSSVGIYTYRITQNVGKTAGVEYDREPVYLIVSVTRDEDGKLVRNCVLKRNGLKLGERTPAFTNIYNAGQVAVTKKVTGNLGDYDKYFNVEVTLTAPQLHSNVKSTITVSGGSNKGNPVSIGTEDWKNGKAVVNIKIKHNDTMTFSNIPYNVTYVVEEDDYVASEKYDAATYKVNEGVATNAVNSNEVLQADNTVLITNNKGADIDTGVVLKNAPYVLILVLAAAGVVLFAFMKRRSHSEME